MKINLSDINQANFNSYALQVFDYQYVNNKVYRQYCDFLNIDKATINSFWDIPFLPITFYKTHFISTHQNPSDKIFESSTTTSGIPSRLYIYDFEIYQQSSKLTFEHYFGPLDQYCIIGLLPNYLERGNSSLVYMVDYFIKLTKTSNSGFYKLITDQLFTSIDLAIKEGKKPIIWGVTYAILDFIDDSRAKKIKNLIVIETGGMKGMQKEMPKKALHELIKNKLPEVEIFSEYGMTELFSQAYSTQDSVFKYMPWMKILTTEIGDPFLWTKTGQRGKINVIDLANFDSCSFIETEDMGLVYEENSFELLGRMDNSDTRGCNLMMLND